MTSPTNASIPASSPPLPPQREPSSLSAPPQPADPSLTSPIPPLPDILRLNRVPSRPQSKSPKPANPPNPPKPLTRPSRPRQHSSPPPAGPSSFTPLAPTSSRLSLSSTNQTFVEAPGLVAALPSLARQSTITTIRQRERESQREKETQRERDRDRDRDRGQERDPDIAVSTRLAGGDGDGDGERSDVLVEEKDVLRDGQTVEEEIEGGTPKKAVLVLPDGQEIEYPDGGKEAWLAVVGGLAALFCGFGLTASLGAFQTYYRTSLLSDYSSSTIAWVTGTQGFFAFFLTAFTGSLFDKYGHRPLVASGTFLVTFGYMMLSLCHAYWQLFICHAAIIAPGINLMFISPVGVVGQWFFVKRGLAFGIMMMGASVGAVVWPLLVANLPQRIGFGWTVRLIGFICLLCGITAFFLLKTRLPPKPAGPFFYARAFRDPAYCCLALASLTYIFSFFTFLMFIGTYGQLVGMGTLASYLLVIVNASSGPGRIIFGLSADFLGVYNVSSVSVAVMAVLYWCWMTNPPASALIAIAVIFGFASGAFVSLQAPMCTSHATDMRVAGTMVGQVLFFQSFGQLLGPPIFGKLLGTGTAAEQAARSSHAISFGASMMTASALFLFIARFSIDKRPFAKV
ncbi:hypothetical protein JCM24511_04408 [Saitozyma sp. JCM 24511]|nr:hypothetical protein JCM24511_04408 [Saitozyma sp. JCM 24511]